VTGCVTLATLPVTKAGKGEVPLARRHRNTPWYGGLVTGCVTFATLPVTEAVEGEVQLVHIHWNTPWYGG
jgi:hypothetical protein